MEIVKIDTAAKTLQKIEDYVAEERPIHIFLNKRHYATVMCTPKDLKEMVFGHLLTGGMVKAVEEVEKITVKKDFCHVNLKTSINLETRLKLVGQLSRVIPSACGGPYRPQTLKTLKKINSKTAVRAETIQNCVNNLNCMAENFRKTGGVHAAAVYKTDGTLLAFAEDVGRHNAVDKAIGKCALQKADFNECFLTLSGRLTADIVLKAARVGIPIVASIAAALDSGIEVAKKANLTLIGFVRGRRMNVYNAPERVLLS
ncbi:formate dehydrogenase accessory sulfurtransferase FdhD [Candidatus Bathyarchaeota archaeon]|nr:formate dehydrogenase accessory sulfurtransferase FdhD [Candidatus Bathyarchaeota archaeon]